MWLPIRFISPPVAFELPAVQNRLDGTVPLDVAKGVTNKLTVPIPVAVTVDGFVRITLMINNKETVVSLDLTQVVTVVNAVAGLVTVVLRVVETAVNGVDTMKVLNAVDIVVAQVVAIIPA